MKSLEAFASTLEHIKNTLSPYTKRAYLVGGCVRDMYLKQSFTDIDIEIYDIDEEQFDVLMKSIKAKGVGKNFFVYKYQNFDLALPRKEAKVSNGHQGFEVSISQNEKEASKRRDFTMNALMINIFNEEVLDFWGGREDIRHKMIRHIDDKAFCEDSLRILRAIQFCARFDFEIHPRTFSLMQTISIDDLSKTRIFWELEKFFKAKALHVGLKYFFKLGLFEKIFALHVSEKEYEKMQEKLKNAHFLEELKEYYLLYIICEVLKKEPKELLQKLEISNKYQKIFKYQPYFDKIPSSKKLLEIAMHIPIKKWLGNYRPQIVRKAKEFGCFDEVFTGGVNIQDIINDGFCKEAIKKEYTKRVLAKIEELVS